MTTRLVYPTDLSDAEWSRLAHLVPAPLPGGRPPKYDRREILNAILYLLRAGCAWRLLPHDLPPWQIVYHYFRRWRKDQTWERLHDRLRVEVREAEGREAEPSAAILDAQSVKTADHCGARGFDAGKQVNGRKRHILVDTIGLLLVVVVHAANLQDREGARLVLEALTSRFKRLRLIWAAGNYSGKLIEWVRGLRKWGKVKLEIVERREGVKGFEVLPRRWVVERTFGWLVKCRRLSKDYEQLRQTSEAMIRVAMIGLMVRRLARRPTF
jgi:putative transposase